MEKKKEFTNKEDFLLDMLEYYVGHPDRRCVSSGGGCFYSPINAGKQGISEGCAFGRHLEPELQLELDGSGTVSSIALRSDKWILVPQWLKNLEVGFLYRIQTLHDDGNNWTIKGVL